MLQAMCKQIHNTLCAVMCCAVLRRCYVPHCAVCFAGRGGTIMLQAMCK
jgi:hypothetical protein